MTADPKLVEAVARAIARIDAAHEWEGLTNEYTQYDGPGRNDYLTMAHGVIAAINASGEWWVAPWEADATMRAHGAAMSSMPLLWDAMRTAYLAKTEETEK